MGWVSHLETYAKRVRAEDYPWAPTAEERAHFFEQLRADWGGPVGLEERAPSKVHDAGFREWWAEYLRMGASPGAAVALTRMNAEVDVRSVLPTVRVPTLVLHRCAVAVGGYGRRVGMEVRAGLHTGECELHAGGGVGGVAVEVGREVSERAAAGEVLVSPTVRDLVAGSGLGFEQRGAETFNAAPGVWRPYKVRMGGSGSQQG